VATFSNQLVVYGVLTGTDTQPPSAPANLTVSGTTSTSVSLSWRASTDNVGVDGYYVYRTVQGRTTLAKTVTGTTYTDTGLSRNSNYSYSIKAYDAAGNVSQASNSVKAKTSR
jgi:chitodextrinase